MYVDIYNIPRDLNPHPSYHGIFTDDLLDIIIAHVPFEIPLPLPIVEDVD